MPDAELTPEIIREFVIAAHFNADKVQSMLAEQPALLQARHQWGEGDYEDGLGAAAHVGSRRIAEYLLAQGAPLTIFAAAMLGRTADAAAFLQADPTLANGHGAHRIPILFHAALSGDTAVTELLYTNGCREGFNDAVHAAIMSRSVKMLEWLLEHGATDVQALNYEGKTPLKKAVEANEPQMISLLKNRGAVE
ncbi:MAG: ankyrin repeat domain-containing protein [Chloroflexi bacterium]|nr:ankyrin repeat domain-containing protein [Chloroflexota bacterium]MCC6892791.1 ankyrin repeat domain-containing protein [Anaerolineae bacterium]